MASLSYAQSSWSTVGLSDHVFMDGHDSHFDREALDLLASKHAYVFFLKSNNSEEGQPTTTGRTVP